MIGRNVELTLCLRITPWSIEGMVVNLHAFLISELGRREWSASCSPVMKGCDSHWLEGYQMVPQSWSGGENE